MAKSMQDIYERLQPLGFNKKFVRECILPDWWKDELADVPANRAYAEAILARFLCLDLASLRSKDAQLRPQFEGSCKLKHRHGVADHQFSVALLLGSRLAGIANRSLDTTPGLSGLTASSVRSEILDSGAPWVGFEQLMEYCWRIGVPVLHLCQIPRGAQKPDGMAIWTEDRPSIVIASAKSQPAWHLFIIAHELGHILLGHLRQGEVSVDKKVQMEASESDEIEANAFAVELLSGDPDISFSPPPRKLNAQQLAFAATSIGRKFKIDPGFIALSYSRSQGFIPVGVAALNELNPEADACSMYRRYYEHLELDDLTEDNKHVFECLTEVA